MYKSPKISPIKQSPNQSQLSKKQISEQDIKNKMRMISMLLRRLYCKKIGYAWERIKLLPSRWLKIQTRMKQTIENVFKRQDYTAKWSSFQNIKRTALTHESHEAQYLQTTLSKQRATMIRLLTVFVMGKKKRMFQIMIKKIKDYGNWKEFYWNSKHRKAIRICADLVRGRIQQTFNKIKDTRATVDFVKKCRSMFAIVKEIYTQNRRWAFVTLRREMLRNKQEKASEEIKQIDEKLAEGEDEEIKNLKEKEEELQKLLEEAKRQKEEITAQFEAEVKEADTRNKEMKDHLEDLKTRQQEMKDRIAELNEQIKVPYSLQEIYQLCYQNFLWTVSQNTEKTFSKEALLQSLQTPIVPIDLPLDKLKEENAVLKELLSEYILMYGQKKVPEGTKLELPYQYLLKENNTLYRMLITLLPNAQFLKDQLLKLRQSFEDVGNSLKQLNYK